MREEVDAKTMQGIAFEMNLSETAFVTPLLKDQDFSNATQFNLRWFTPKVEVPLCGHVAFIYLFFFYFLLSFHFFLLFIDPERYLGNLSCCIHYLSFTTC